MKTNKQAAQYIAGLRDGKAAFINGDLTGSREWSSEYKRGYSDGYWKAKGRPKKW
jgi:hypothetical protein